MCAKCPVGTIHNEFSGNNDGTLVMIGVQHVAQDATAQAPAVAFTGPAEVGHQHVGDVHHHATH